MSEESKKKRSVEEIQTQYSQLCTKAGYLQYQVWIFSKDLDLVLDQMRDLNFEAGALKAAEPKEEGSKE